MDQQITGEGGGWEVVGVKGDKGGGGDDWGGHLVEAESGQERNEMKKTVDGTEGEVEMERERGEGIRGLVMELGTDDLDVENVTYFIQNFYLALKGTPGDPAWRALLLRIAVATQNNLAQIERLGESIDFDSFVGVISSIIVLPDNEQTSNVGRGGRYEPREEVGVINVSSDERGRKEGGTDFGPYSQKSAEDDMRRAFDIPASPGNQGVEAMDGGWSSKKWPGGLFYDYLMEGAPIPPSIQISSLGNQSKECIGEDEEGSSAPIPWGSQVGTYDMGGAPMSSPSMLPEIPPPMVAAGEKDASTSTDTSLLTVQETMGKGEGERSPEEPELRDSEAAATASGDAPIISSPPLTRTLTQTRAEKRLIWDPKLTLYNKIPAYETVEVESEYDDMEEDEIEREEVLDYFQDDAKRVDFGVTPKLKKGKKNIIVVAEEEEERDERVGLEVTSAALAKPKKGKKKVEKKGKKKGEKKATLRQRTRAREPFAGECEVLKEKLDIISCTTWSKNVPEGSTVINIPAPKQVDLPKKVILKTKRETKKGQQDGKKSKKVECQLCGGWFSGGNSGLKRHQETHCPNRPPGKLLKFQCGYPGCNAVRARMDNLITHFKVHQGLEFWRCPYCGKVFKANIFMNNHIKHRHEKN